MRGEVTKSDDHDTPRIAALRPEDVEPAAVRKFKYRTDPGVTTDHDKELLRGVSRARDAREARAETLGKLVDDVKDEREPRPSPAPPAVRHVTIVHKNRFPLPVTLALFAVPIAVLVVAMLVAMKSKQQPQPENAAATTTATASTPTASSPEIAPVVTAPLVVTVASVTATAIRAAAPRATGSGVRTPPATSTAPNVGASEHHDTDIVRTPEL